MSVFFNLIFNLIFLEINFYCILITKKKKKICVSENLRSTPKLSNIFLCLPHSHQLQGPVLSTRLLPASRAPAPLALCPGNSLCLECSPSNCSGSSILSQLHLPLLKKVSWSQTEEAPTLAISRSSPLPRPPPLCFTPVSLFHPLLK